MLTPEGARPLIQWANERQAIYLRKQVFSLDWDATTCEQPWWSDMWGHGGWRADYLTDDPVLRNYRFCNVYREQDRVTIWIKENIRDRWPDRHSLWFMLAAARTINWPPALQELIERGAWPGMGDDPHLLSNMTAVLEARKARGDKCETGAFMIRAESDPRQPHYSWSKQRYVCEIVLGRLWDNRKAWENALDLKKGQPSLEYVWETLQAYRGWGPFMAGQVVTDMRWTRYLLSAPDIQTWAALGPGSRRGLNRLHGRDPKAALSQERGLGEMLELRQLLSQPGVLAPWVPLPDLSDVQNALCETDKYLRVLRGEGTPRAHYVPGRGS